MGRLILQGVTRFIHCQSHPTSDAYPSSDKGPSFGVAGATKTLGPQRWRPDDLRARMLFAGSTESRSRARSGTLRERVARHKARQLIGRGLPVSAQARALLLAETAVLDAVVMIGKPPPRSMALLILLSSGWLLRMPSTSDVFSQADRRPTTSQLKACFRCVRFQGLLFRKIAESMISSLPQDVRVLACILNSNASGSHPCVIEYV